MRECSYAPRCYGAGDRFLVYVVGNSRLVCTRHVTTAVRDLCATASTTRATVQMLTADEPLA